MSQLIKLVEAMLKEKYSEEDLDWSEDEQIRAVQRQPKLLFSIDNPSEKVQIAAVQAYPRLMRWIKHPSEAVQLAAVQAYPGYIRFIEHPSEEVQLAAVESDPRSIDSIEDPTDKVWKIAGEYSHRNDGGYAPDELGWSVERHDEEDYYNQDSDEEGANINDWNEEAQVNYVTRNPHMIDYIKNPSEKVQLAAVTNDLTTFFDIRNPTKKVKNFYKKWKE